MISAIPQAQLTAFFKPSQHFHSIFMSTARILKKICCPEWARIDERLQRDTTIGFIDLSIQRLRKVHDASELIALD
tara:strand:+ start:212 stop:439 length:228 start_codon:yes stop_codon:yes gene_type:complete